MSVESPQPLGPADVFSRGFGLWRRNLGPMAAVALVVLVPMQLLSELIGFITDPRYLASIEELPELIEALGQLMQNPTGPVPSILTGPEMSGGSAALATLGSIVTILIALIGLALVVGSCLALAMAAANGEPITWRAALNAAMDKLQALLMVQLITWILLSVLAGFTFFVLSAPAIWLGVAWCVSMAAVLFEGKVNFQALSRSFHLVRHRWWATAGAGALTFLVTLPIGLATAVPMVGWLAFGWEFLPCFIAGTILGVLGSAITTPIGASVMTSIYLDLRLRKDGQDTQGADS